MDPAIENFGYDLDTLTWRWIDGNRRRRASSFSHEHELIGDRAIELVNATKRICQYGAGNTIHNRLTGMRACVAAIAAFAPQSDSVSEWAQALIKNLTQDETKAELSRWNTFNWAIGILVETARLRGEQLYIRNPFTRKSKDRQVTSDDVRSAIMSRAKKDVAAYLRDIEEPPSEHLEFISRARDLAARNEGIIPNLSVGLAYRLRDSWFRRTKLGIQKLTRYLYPSADDLAPFLLLITEALAGNPDSVALIRRDAMESFVHPAYGQCFKLKMDKPRASDIEPYLLRGQGTLSVSSLIRSVMKMTEPLVAHTGDLNRNLVFLAVASSGIVHPMLGATRVSAIRRYLRDRGLPYTSLRSLRVSRAVSEYKQSKDVFRVKRLLRQSDVAVTIQYLDDATAAEVDAATIADVQSAMLTPVNDKAVRRSKNASVSLPSHTCLDPNDPEKVQDEFGVCAALMFPFNDRNFIFDYNPRSVAFVLREYAALCEAQQTLVGERFTVVYARRKEFIETEVLPNIDESLRVEAEAILANLPPLPYMD